MSAKSVSAAENRAGEVLDLLDADPARDQTRLSGELSRLNGCPVSLNQYSRSLARPAFIIALINLIFSTVSTVPESGLLSFLIETCR
ncbi:hypothetical protein T3A99_13845 [Pseudomonas sp. N-137]|uniref:hypothetical protein n=1 Tax=unclassified Pseudomonas TaxID=196821 RepID=UPI002ADEB97F|nr:hypothetical protein [Pseudomonas sp. N-137]MEA1029645.1 hypothetical protein [Pseudomonas sp. N-137]